MANECGAHAAALDAAASVIPPILSFILAKSCSIHSIYHQNTNNSNPSSRPIAGSCVSRRAPGRRRRWFQRRLRSASVRQHRSRPPLRLRRYHLQRPLQPSNDGRASRSVLWFLGLVLQHVPCCAAARRVRLRALPSLYFCNTLPRYTLLNRWAEEAQLRLPANSPVQPCWVYTSNVDGNSCDSHATPPSRLTVTCDWRQVCSGAAARLLGS